LRPLLCRDLPQEPSLDYAALTGRRFRAPPLAIQESGLRYVETVRGGYKGRTKLGASPLGTRSVGVGPHTIFSIRLAAHVAASDAIMATAEIRIVLTASKDVGEGGAVFRNPETGEALPDSVAYSLCVFCVAKLAPLFVADSSVSTAFGFAFSVVFHSPACKCGFVAR